MSIGREKKKRKVMPFIVSGAVILLVLIGLFIFTNRPDTEVIEQQSLPVVTSPDSTTAPISEPMIPPSTAIVTIVDDDGSEAFLTNMKSTLDAAGVKSSLAIITDKVGTKGYMSKQQLLDLQSDGYEIISHTKSHTPSVFKENLAGVPDSSYDVEFGESQKWLVDNGFIGSNTVVYPWGNFGTETDRIKKIAGKYYQNGLNALGSYNLAGSDALYLDRYQLIKNQDFNSKLKPIIDSCIAENGWLILLTHSFDQTNFSSEYLEQTIKYLEDNNVKILTFGEASNLKLTKK